MALIVRYVPFVMNPQETIFSKIIRREIPADIIYETDQILAFRDINPQAPVHVLIIPKKIIRDVNHLDTADGPLVGELFAAAKIIARQEGVVESGYRLVMNNGEGAGQSVFHMHLHLLGGRDMQWPPG